MDRILDKMIGFRCKNINLRASLPVFVILLLAACAPPVVKEEPGKAISAPAPVEPETGDPKVSVPPVSEPEQLTPSLLYGMLLGEIAGQRGQLDVSGASYLEAARQSNDPRVAERALKISVYAKKQQLALQAARRWVELAPSNIEARQSLAVLALRTGNQQEALEQFDYLLKRSKAEGSDPYQSLLALLAREPEQDRALKVMEQLVALRPQDPGAHFAYARLAVHAKNQPLAEQEVERSLQLRPDWTQALILQAQINLDKGQGELARQQLYAALQRKPKDADLRLAYARLLVDLDDFDAARAEYRTLLKQRPDDGQIIYSLALLALEANQLKEAQEFFEKLVKLDYQTQQAYYYLGAIAEEQNNRSRALKWYQKVEQGDHWIEVQIRIARLEVQGDDVDAARERLRKLRLGHPAQAQRLFLVEGDILIQLERFQEAYNLYSQYLETQPDDTEILYARALAAEKLDRLDAAERDFRKVLQQDPENTRTLNALGYTLADRTDRYQEALVYVQKAFAQTPDDPAVIDSMGWVLYRLGRLQEAREYLQKAYDMTGDGEIGAHLGEVMWTMGDKDAARAVWDKARKDAPGNAVLEETLKRFSP
ncbi:MAG: tetratricopeptide repeat protein [Thiogranum sp.]